MNTETIKRVELLNSLTKTLSILKPSIGFNERDKKMHDECKKECESILEEVKNDVDTEYFLYVDSLNRFNYWK